MDYIRHFLDWLFKDFSTRRGGYVIAEVPNIQLVIFMISALLAVIVYPGFWQTLLAVMAYVFLVWWGIREARSGRSRFRKVLGWCAVMAVIGALLLKLGF